MNRIIAVDFDGTLCHGNWPGVGEPNRKLETSKRGQQNYFVDMQGGGCII